MVLPGGPPEPFDLVIGLADVFIPLASSDTNEIELRGGTDERTVHVQGVRREHPGGWQFAWGYAIDTDDYLASLA